MKAIIKLSCEGRQDEGFWFCKGVENTILDLENITHKENYLELIKYLDNVPKLFDTPSCTNNIIVNTIYKIYEMAFLTEKQYQKITYFYKQHLFCGMVMKILPKEIK